MEISVVSDENGEILEKIDITDKVFNTKYNESLIHQVVTCFINNGHTGTKCQKRRSDVNGGGAKPWRQKGTGRARAGTSRSPIWRKGGVTFAAKPLQIVKKINKKMYRAAMRSILSELIRQEKLLVIDEFTNSSKKTKDVISKLNVIGLNDKKCYIVTEAKDLDLSISARCASNVTVNSVNDVSPTNLINNDKTVITKNAVKKIEAWLE